jgi:hypothetical protein
MARKTITVSDLSGQELTNSNHARITVILRDSRYEIDAMEAELVDLLKVARKSKRPGRKATTA